MDTRRLRSAVVGALGSRPVATVTRTVWSRRLRVLGYHGVPDADAFARQLDHVLAAYRPVTGADVARALDGGPALPRRAVWITFDDGLTSVIRNAMPLLSARRVPATLFVCPGLVGDGAAPWWQVVTRASQHGWRDAGADDAAGLVDHLKTVPDHERRAELADAVGHPGRMPPFADPSVDEPMLRRWFDAGFEIGNHTWDHPVLDRCSPDEQRRQIVDADEWLAARGLWRNARLFAYPHGHHTDAARATLQELGYSVAVLFDHRMVALRGDVRRLRLSRLRLEADESVVRCRAVASGGWSIAEQLAGALRVRY